MSWNLNSLTKDYFQRIRLIEAHNALFKYDLISRCETSLNHSPSNPLVRKRVKFLLFRPGMLNIRSRDFNRAQNVNKRRMRIRMANDDSRYYDT